MKEWLSGGIWPTMLTPFNMENDIDFNGVESLVKWYIKKKVSGLFAICQSSEMFFLSLKERIELIQCIKKVAGGKIPVIASGHISDSIKDQIYELNNMADTGIDALILISNRLAKKNEDDDVWIKNLNYIIKNLPENIPLGIYECPFPYKRLLTDKLIKACDEGTPNDN